MRAHIVHVMIAAGEQRDAGRRTERGRVELVVAQAIVGERLDRRHMDRAAEGARLAEAHVVDQHDQDVRRASGALTSKRGGGFALRASNSV